MAFQIGIAGAMQARSDLFPSEDVQNVVASPYDINFQMVEVVRNVNRFDSSIKHKPNVFSVVVENSNLTPDTSTGADESLEQYKSKLRDSVTQFVRNACTDIAPAHTQLIKVQFT